jgi:hypothetical protein
MDEANQYLGKMFGRARGYVSVAYKDTGNSWQEHQFAWPADRKKILGWARVHHDANIFICPTLRRDAHTRKKGDGIHLRWLFADVDWEKVPTSKKALVRKRIDQLGTYIVASGTGENVHVYVALAEEVSVDKFLKLNTGLRDYLYADNKQADNSLLRLPGMTNWKTSAGSPVRVVGGNRKMRRPESLMTLRAFSQARVTTSSVEGTWSKVDLAAVPVRMKRLARMGSDEARGRYGSRHKAVWAVVGDMHKAGLSGDQIHTLLDEFPPAVDKRDDEHGAYDVHKDIDRRLKADLAVGQGGDDDSPFSELSDSDIVALGPDNPLVVKELARRAAMREVEHIEATRRFIAPPPDVSWSAADGLANPPEVAKYLIGGTEQGHRGLAGIKHNVVITAQYKVGKTAFTLASLAKSLCDGTDFLGQFPVPAEGRIVGHWNCEMEGFELLDDYIRPCGMKHPERLAVANLRGYGVNILTPVGKAWAVQWLKERGVQVWTIDSLARLLHMAGVKEKENDEVLNVLMAIDEIKVQAGVDVCFIIAHTGRADAEEGKEHARGATVIDDWPDTRWIMTKDGDPRFLWVDGRGTGLPTTSLDFNHDTKVSTLGVAGKGDVRADGAIQSVLEIVTANAGIAKEPLVRKVCERVKVRAPAAREYIEEAVENGWVQVRREARTGGGRASQKHYPVSEKTNGGATRRAVDFRKV